MTKQTNGNKGLWIYFVLTYAIALLTWGTMIVFQIPGAAAATAAKVSPVGILIMMLGGFSPSIAGIFMTWRFEGHLLHDLWQRTKQVKFGWKWYLAILSVPLLSLIIQIGVQLARGEQLTQSPLLAHPLNLIGFTILLILGGALAEEFGWRGFALDRLLERWNLWISSLILGILWAFWHLPLFFVPGTVQASRGNIPVEFSIFALWIMSLAFLFTWIYLGTNRSLFAVLLFHTAVDWVQSFSGTIISGSTIDRLVHSLVFAIITMIVVFWWNPNRNPTTSTKPASSLFQPR